MHECPTEDQPSNETKVNSAVKANHTGEHTQAQNNIATQKLKQTPRYKLRIMGHKSNDLNMFAIVIKIRYIIVLLMHEVNECSICFVTLILGFQSSYFRQLCAYLEMALVMNFS